MQGENNHLFWGFMSESVLVVKNSLIRPFIPQEGPCLITNEAMTIYETILGDHSFMPRAEAEEDYSHKQAIPYVAVRHGGRYLMLRRTNKQTERRLHDKMSLGLGGHINPGENSNGDIIMSALHRELEEEVHITRPAGLTFAGIINDESNNVSKGHLGLLFILEAASDEFQVRETDLMSAKWADTKEMDSHYDAFETWSRVILDSFIHKREPLNKT